MFEYSPRPRLSEISAAEQEAVRKLDRRRKRQLGATATLLATTGLLTTYWNDVHEQKQIQTEAAISVSTIDSSALNPENDDRAVVVVDGFGTYDADWLSGSLGNEARTLYDGQLWSVSYGNAPLSEKRIAEEVIEKAEATGVESVAFLGYSAGGIIATDVITHIMNDRDNNLDIPLSILASTPYGEDGLRDNRKSEVDIAKVIKNIPGAEYSTTVRTLGEVFFQQYRIHDFDSFTTVMEDVQNRMKNNRLPQTWLLIDQVLAISSANFPDRYTQMQHASEERGTPPPVVVYLGTGEGGYDEMVKDDYSSEQVCKAARQALLTCLTYEVPGATHYRPDLAVDSYHQVLSSAAPKVDGIITADRQPSLDPLTIARERTLP